MYMGPDRSSIRSEGFKYILTHPRGLIGFQAWDAERGLGGDGRPLLFDLTRDPDETSNIIDREPERAAELHRRLLERLAGVEWGLHLLSTLVEIKPLSLEPDDGLDLAPTRRTITLSVGGADSAEGVGLERGDWVVLRFADREPRVNIKEDGVTVADIDAWSGLAQEPPEDRGAATDCVHWVVRVESPPSLVLDEGQLERLRTLGYL
jgi:hypothetical protein